MISQTFEKAKEYGINDDDFAGFFCIPCYFEKKNTIIWNYRVSHLIKVHNFAKSSLPKEGVFEIKDPIEASKFDILLKNEKIRCPHCDNLLLKQLHVGRPDFVIFVCLNAECIKKWEKVHGGGYFQTSELIAPKKKFYCAKHDWNSNEESCTYCIRSVEMNKIAGEINKVILGVQN